MTREAFKDRINTLRSWICKTAHKYVAQEYSASTDTSKNNKNPIELLISIFKPTNRDLWLLSISITLAIFHLILYSFNIPFIPELIKILLMLAFTLYLARVSYTAYQNNTPIIKSFKSNPLQFFTFIIALGGMSALTIPAMLNVFKLIGDSTPLTTAMLGITGGIIAVFGLIKSHQKSELEREQLDTQKQKDARDHIRQLHGSYNDRFDKAVAELNSNDTKTAYAAVPKLAKLADAWLDYKDLSDNKKELKKLKKKAKKESQTIINILCKYIRTIPGDYTEKDLKDIANLSATDQDKLKNESEVRRLIFSEMSDRSSKATFENEKLSITPGAWSEFDFNFSRAPIFYPLNTLTIEKGVFTSAKFYGNADFSGSTFIKDTAFNGVQFTQEANFNEVNFNGKADFSAQGDTKTNFEGKAIFNGAQFAQEANFNGAQFAQEANFNEVNFNGKADFSNQNKIETIFMDEAIFKHAYFNNEALFKGTNFKDADFSGSAGKDTIFKEKTIFIGAHFSGKSSFNNISFDGVVDFSCKDPSSPAMFSNQTEFSDTTFESKADFTSLVVDPSQNPSGLTFQKVHFKGKAIFENAQFSQIVEFKETEFQEGANFKNAHFYYSAKFIEKTKFKQKANFLGSMFGQDLEINANFEHDADFSLSRIGSFNGVPQKIVFQNSTFEKSADFCEVKFYDDVKFLDTRFRMKADFSDAKFYGEASFNRSYQHQTTSGHFLYSMFEKEAIFCRASFFDDADFQNMRFCNQVDFTKAHFDKSINFTDTVFQSDLCCSECNFSSLAPIFDNAKFKINTIRLFNLNPISIKINLRPLSINDGNLTKIYILPVGSYLFSGNNPNSPVAGPTQ